MSLPKVRGPYSHSIKAAGLLFIAGQLPLDLEATIEVQTKQVLDNIEAILASENLTLEHVVRTEIYLKDLADAPVVNTVYAERFSHPIKPVRQMMQVAKLPLDVRIEISAIAKLE